MTIKDQCNKCKWLTLSHCSYLNCNIQYDGTSCKHYSNISIDLLKSDNLDHAKANDIEENVGKEKIRGWLTFFLIVVGLGSTISVIYGLATLSLANYDVGLGYWISVFGATCDAILIIGYAVLGVYTIFSFYNYKPNAVALGKTYLILVFSFNLITLLSGESDEEGLFSHNRIIYHLFWGIIWFWYLCQSKQVNSLFPKKNRKMYKRDKILLFSIVMPIIIWLVFVFSSVFSQEHQDEFIINESTLSINEYTDRRIIFERPVGISVEKQVENDETYFSLEQDDNISMTLYSVFDNNDTQEYFEECMQGWKDEYLNDFEYGVIDETHYISDGNSIYQKTLQYYSEPVIEWSFVLIFNKETSKCCVLSCFSTIETNYLDELITSIRFK